MKAIDEKKGYAALVDRANKMSLLLGEAHVLLMVLSKYATERNKESIERFTENINDLFYKDR